MQKEILIRTLCLINISNLTVVEAVFDGSRLSYLAWLKLIPIKMQAMFFSSLAVRVPLEWFRLSLKHMWKIVIILTTVHPHTAVTVLYMKLRLQCSLQCSYTQNMILMHRCTTPQQSLAQQYLCSQWQWRKIISAAGAQKAQTQPEICFPSSQTPVRIALSHSVWNGHSHIFQKSIMLHSC